MSIQYKIIFGYMVLIVAIIGMIIIMVRERNRVLVIETEAQTIHRVQHNGNIVQHHITILSTYGETALSWEEEDFANYHSLRLHIDSMLQAMHKGYEEFVSQSQIDSLRYLLSSKEEHLYQIMQLFHSQNSQEGMQFSHLPAEAQPRTVIRKKKGFTGFLGAKETLEIVPSASTILKTLNKELLSMQEERQESINAYTDSLRNHNKELNRKLRHLITTMNNQTERVLEAKECHLRESYNRSICVISWLIISAIILLVISYLIIQKDLREKARTRKRLEDTIQQNTALLEMRKNIILTISHDIRAPLNVIDGSADLAMDTREKKRRNIHLNNIRRVCKHVVHLLNNLLDVYRLNEAKEIRNDVPFDLHELLERTAAGFSHIINNKGILFNCDFKDTEVKLYGDADRIEQIIDNLLTNAVKFTETGTINFNVHYLNGLLVMEIVDTGVGMSEETLSRIFRPFERQTSATNADGFGLGLPITQGLVNLLDGTIEVTSLINCGSTFRVTLPMPETDEPLESEKHVPAHSTHLHHNVLVIDDDSMLQAVIKEMLERNGMACTTCTTVKEVVKAMREKDYDLLLTDILMPYTNGFELLTLLRNSSIGNSKTIPIVAMTARGEKEKDAFLNAGFTACIYKPFSSTELIGLLLTIERGCPDKKHDVDFSMMLCEVSDKIKLLCSFIDQSKKDVEELNSAIENCNRKKLRETVHRMLPMWELLHNEEMLFAYRSLLKDERASDTALKEYTQRIINHTDMLMAAAKNEIKRQTNETENTDS